MAVRGVFLHMATRFVSMDRDTPLLLPPNLRDWVPADHLVHFILDAVDSLDLRQVRVNTRGTGSEQYPPAMLLCLLLYSYATGTFGSPVREPPRFYAARAHQLASRAIHAQTTLQCGPRHLHGECAFGVAAHVVGGEVKPHAGR